MSWDIQPADKAVLVTMNTNKVNAINGDFFRDLHEAFDTIEQNYPEHAVVLTGQGKVFCAGLDFAQVFPMFAKGDQFEIKTWFADLQKALVRTFAFAQPLVAAINGHAFAGGLILALGADVRVASQESKMSLNEVAIGIPMPAAFVTLIRHAVGIQNAEQSILSAQVYQGEACQQLGFCHAQVEPNQVVEAALEHANRLRPPAMSAYRFSKRALRQTTLDAIEHAAAIDEALPKLFSDETCVKAQQAAFEKLKGK